MMKRSEKVSGRGDDIPGLPATRNEIERYYPGLTGPDGAMWADAQEWYRLNPSGCWFALRNWYLDRSTGEFYRITRRLSDGSVCFDAIPYSARIAARTNGKALAVALLLLSCLGLAELVAAGLSGLGAVYWAAALTLGVVLFSGLGGALLDRVSGMVLLSDWRVGPEPLMRKSGRFGASSTEPPTDHAAAGDLEYRPMAQGQTTGKA